jgi:hypothetical protein
LLLGTNADDDKRRQDLAKLMLSLAREPGSVMWTGTHFRADARHRSGRHEGHDYVSRPVRDALFMARKQAGSFGPVDLLVIVLIADAAQKPVSIAVGAAAARCAGA